jgi:hypothetical protein
MEILIVILKWVIGPIVSFAVTLVVSDPLKNVLAPLVCYLGSKTDEGIKGRWKATFYYGDDETPHNELIQISILLGSVVGHVLSHPDGHDQGSKNNRFIPLRLRGNIKDNRYFTGVWFHPHSRSRHHGAFELLIDVSNTAMSGVWLGYNEKHNVVASGRWVWVRIDD